MKFSIKNFFRKCFDQIWSKLYFLCSVVCHSDANFFVRGYFWQYTNFLRISDKELVIVSAIIPVHAAGKQGELKAAPDLTGVPSSFGTWRSVTSG